jgi:hypothetical protein
MDIGPRVPACNSVCFAHDRFDPAVDMYPTWLDGTLRRRLYGTGAAQTIERTKAKTT